MISVLLSAYNESSNPYFWKTIDLVKSLKSGGMNIELLVGVTKGDDDTLTRLVDSGVKLVEIHTNKRAERYNAAFKVSTGTSDSWILLNHPRSCLQENAFHSLLAQNNSVKWGAFTHEFDFDHPLLIFTSWWSNSVRGDIKKIFYLDHCLFVRKSLLEKVGGLPSVEIFEDTILSLKLGELYQPTRSSWKSTTSAIRFKSKGVWNQAIQNQMLKLRFLLGESDSHMNDSYEKSINLNR
ncbi:MAG: hypothetical protein K2P81_11530 [Bacteriovoracaceae bacterium]|nr:hypothetical protein [Bacteriovoracaceae bacterium]